MAKVKERGVKEEKKYGLKQLLESEQFTENRDILSVVMREDEQLTVDELKKRIEKFLKSEVS